MQAYVNGELVTLTPEQEAAFLAEQAASRVVPQSITFRQFYQQLYVLGIITEAELLAAVKSNDMPSALEALVDALPSAQQLPAKVLIYGGTSILREHPISQAIMTAFGWNAEQGDDFFIAAAAL